MNHYELNLTLMRRTYEIVQKFDTKRMYLILYIFIKLYEMSDYKFVDFSFMSSPKINLQILHSVIDGTTLVLIKGMKALIERFENMRKEAAKLGDHELCHSLDLLINRLMELQRERKNDLNKL